MTTPPPRSHGNAELSSPSPDPFDDAVVVGRGGNVDALAVGSVDVGSEVGGSEVGAMCVIGNSIETSGANEAMDTT
ncbi:MAG: hypothetical protein E6Q57_16390 [Mycobacterium sp.]|nr:MAG: hypothetical protein E6Q57_16390 [Mycobacterium sp.]